MNQTSCAPSLVIATDLSATLGGRTEVLALVGPNGAGKNTLLSLLAGGLLPTTGTIMLDGQPLTMPSAQQQAQRRAVLRQQVGLGFAFTALEVALMGRHPHLHGRVEGPHDVALAYEKLAQTEMLVHAERFVPTLSGGEQARVQLTRVLAQQAPLLLLDEPTAALDLPHQHNAVLSTGLEGGGVCERTLHRSVKR
ncbi:MAG: ATP-binding cassette domain-containing protein [Blastochloris sp.]|nr:ATP-binding cassette domain-containing protein [Blastochloris sp.]